MAVEFKIIRNPRNLILKHEVWIKGDAVHTDSLGQVVNTQGFCQKGPSFITRSGAEGFIQYQNEYREFAGEA